MLKETWISTINTLSLFGLSRHSFRRRRRRRRRYTASMDI